MLNLRVLGAFAVAAGLGACAGPTEPRPVATCPPGQVMTYAAGCVTPDRNRPKNKDDYVDYKPLKVKDSAMTGEEDTNPFGKTGAQSIPARQK